MQEAVAIRGFVKLVRGVRVVCSLCEEIVPGVAQRVAERAPYLAGRHPGADGKPCLGSLQDAQVATVLAATEAPANVRWYRLVVERWNRECPAGKDVAVRLEAGGPEYRAETISIAWIGERGPVVAIAERDDPLPLDRMRPLQAGEALPPLAAAPRPSRRRQSSGDLVVKDRVRKLADDACRQGYLPAHLQLDPPTSNASAKVVLTAAALRHGHLPVTADGILAVGLVALGLMSLDEIRRWVSAVARLLPTLSPLAYEARALLKMLEDLGVWMPAPDCFHHGECLSPDPWTCLHDTLDRPEGRQKRRTWRCRCGPCHPRLEERAAGGAGPSPG